MSSLDDPVYPKSDLPTGRTFEVEFTYRHRIDGGEWIDGLPGQAPSMIDPDDMDFDWTGPVCSMDEDDCIACEG